MVAHYLTVAYRDILRQPFSTAIGVLTLSLGLVCVITAYSIVAYWDRSDGQFENVDRTYVITVKLEFDDGGVRTGFFPATNIFFADYIRAEFPALETVARSIGAPDVSISTGDRGLRLTRLIVEPEFLQIFDLPFVAGDSRSALSEPLSVVLTEDVAANLFGSEDPLGKTVTLANQVDVNVTGVVERVAAPSHLSEVEFFASWDVRDAIQRARNPALTEIPQPPENWFGGYCCTTYALLPADGSLTGEQFDDQLLDFAHRRVSPEELSRASFEVGAIPLAGLSVSSLNSALFGSASETFSITVVLFVLGALILAVACLNYANLATARAVKRARDVGLRKVVGAGRAQVGMQYIFESGLLVAAALVFAVAGLAALVPVLRSSLEIDLTAVPLALSPGFYVFIAALLIFVTLSAGAYPAFVLSRIRPVEALRLGRLRGGSRLVSTILVGAQFFAASFLLIVVIVMYTQNGALRRNGLGSSQSPLLVIDNAAALTGVSEDTLRAELLRIPQIEGVTAAMQPPWAGGINLNIVSRTPDPGATGHSVFANFVGPDFFDVFDIPLLAGRVFDPDRREDVTPRFQDRAPDDVLNVIVDRAFTEQLGFASPEAAVGESLYQPRGPAGTPEPAQPVRIIGVVENKPLHLYGIGVTANYFWLSENLEFQIARISGSDVSGALAAVDAMWQRLSPSMPRSRRFLDEVFDESYELFGRINQVFITLAMMAFFISIVGLLGMAIQVAERRRHEIGVRKTLGATVRQIVQMLLKDFGKPVVIANLITWPLAFIVASIYLRVFMYRIPITPWPFLASLIVTTAVAWGTVAGQAVRAARVRPAEVLGCE